MERRDCSRLSFFYHPYNPFIIHMKKNRLFSLSINSALLICCLLTPLELWAKNNINKLNEKIKEYEYVGNFSEGLAVVKKEGKIGFIDKSGDLAIPFNWKLEDNSKFEDLLFYQGRCYIPSVRYRKEYLIDKKGNELFAGKSIKIEKMDDWSVVYVYHKDMGHSVYFMDKKSIKKMDQFENDEVIIVNNDGYNYLNKREMYYFSLENLCQGNIVGKKALEEKYGYRYIPGLNYSPDGVGLLTLLNTQTNKYGIVDEKGNIVVPFQYDNKVYMYYGLLMEAICVERQTDCGMQTFPICTNVYKNGQLLHEKIPYWDEWFAHWGLFWFDAHTEDWRKERESYLDCKYPTTAQISKMLDLNGKEVERFSFGENYLKLMEDYYWQLEDKDGHLIYQKQFRIMSRYQNSLDIEPLDWADIFRLSDNGEVSPLFYSHYMDSGIMSFYPLCEYNKALSDKDNNLNYHHSIKRIWKDRHETYNVTNFESTDILPYNVDEVNHYSDGLLRLRLGERYFFVDEKGNGCPTKD